MAVVGAHAACSHTAKGKLVISQMHEAVVDNASSRGGSSLHGLDHALVLGERVQSKGFTCRELFDQVKHLLQVSVACARQKRAKNFILFVAMAGSAGHSRRPPSPTPLKDGRLDVFVVEIDVTTAIDSALASIDQTSYPFGSRAIDETTEPLGLLWVLAIEFDDGLFCKLKELIRYVGVNETKVRSHTCLAGVRKGAPHETARGVLKVCRAVDDSGRLATQFEEARRQVFGCCGQDKLAYKTGSSEADFVESLLQQSGRDGAVALGHLDAFRIEVFLDEA
eukprot:scaffold122744_cov35-Tisochrysis_lutea.AAC.2